MICKDYTDNNLLTATHPLRRVLRSGGVPTTKSETIHEDLMLSKHTVIKRRKQKRNCVHQDVRVSTTELCELFRSSSEIEELRKFMHTVSRLRILLSDVAAPDEVCSRYPRLEKVEEWEDYSSTQQSTHYETALKSSRGKRTRKVREGKYEGGLSRSRCLQKSTHRRRRCCEQMRRDRHYSSECASRRWIGCIHIPDGGKRASLVRFSRS